MIIKPYRHEVKYYECDRMGITHHSNYVRFMEEARVDWMDQLGYGFDRMEAEGVVSPVVIEIAVSVAETTPLRIVFNYTMKVGGKLVCTATSTHCFLENGRPVALADRFPELYENIMRLPKE